MSVECVFFGEARERLSETDLKRSVRAHQHPSQTSGSTMSEQGRSCESSPIDWVMSSNGMGMDGDFTLPEEAEAFLDHFVQKDTSSEGREEGRGDLTLDDFKVGAALMSSDVNGDEEPPEKRPREDVETASTSSEPPKKRKKKPKGLPKRALSGYNCFFSSERLKIQQEMPGIDFEELGRVVGRRWNELNEEERQPYNLLAKEDSVRYHNEMEAFKRRKEEERKEEEQKSFSNTEEKEDRSKSTKTEPSTSSSSHIHSRSSPDNYQTTQASSALKYALQSGRNEAGGSGLFWSTQQPAHGPHFDVPQTSMKPPGNQTSAFQPQPGAFSFTPGFFPVPPGLEIFLPDANGRERKYTVQYTWQSMTRESAEQFMASLMPPPRNAPPQFQSFIQHVMPLPQGPSSRNRGLQRNPPGMMQYQGAAPPR